jgi:hypothetical protein
MMAFVIITCFYHLIENGYKIFQMKVSIILGNSEGMFGTANGDASFSVAWTALRII